MVGIDPGNEIAGLSLLHDLDRIWSSTVNPWDYQAMTHAINELHQAASKVMERLQKKGVTGKLAELSSIRVVCEAPGHGTGAYEERTEIINGRAVPIREMKSNPATAQGIARSGGMLIAWVGQELLTPRRNVSFRKPQEWRKPLFGPKNLGTEVYKARAQELVLSLFDRRTKSADEAEAILIAYEFFLRNGFV